jgi:hypothetical protein
VVLLWFGPEPRFEPKPMLNRTQVRFRGPQFLWTERAVRSKVRMSI